MCSLLSLSTFEPMSPILSSSGSTKVSSTPMSSNEVWTDPNLENELIALSKPFSIHMSPLSSNYKLLIMSLLVSLSPVDLPIILCQQKRNLWLLKQKIEALSLSCFLLLFHHHLFLKVSLVKISHAKINWCIEWQ